MLRQKIHCYHDRVRFEDVDSMALVYHPVYLTYIERGRCQFLMDRNASLKRILETGLAIVVAHAEVKFLRPLQLEEQFVVATQIEEWRKSIIFMTQVIALNAEDIPKENLKNELRSIKTMRFYAHLKLSVMSLAQKTSKTPPEWLVQALSA